MQNLIEEDAAASAAASNPSLDISPFIASSLELLSPLATGVILDGTHGLAHIRSKARGVGLAFRLERAEPVEPSAPPLFEADWGIEEISQNYGLAKLAVWYDPSEQLAREKKQLVAEVYDFCRYQHIDFMLQLRSSGGQDETIQMVQDFRNFCQLMVLDFPGDALMAATITAELDIPWLVYLGAVAHQRAKEEVRQALESGAAGAVVGEALWQDRSAPLADHVSAEARDRLIEIRRIIDEFAIAETS